MHDILEELEGVVRWGGDYTQTADAMHFEIIVRPGRLRSIGRKLRQGKVKPKLTSRGGNIDEAIKRLRRSKGRGGRLRKIQTALDSLLSIRPFR